MATTRDAGLGFIVPLCYDKTVLVGRGAFGLVARAEVVPGMARPGNAYFDRLATNRVAIKKISSATAYKDSYHAKQVYREISLLKQLTHENIIKLVDLFVSPTHDLYIVTEAMECDLAHFITNLSIEITENHTKYLACQILRGLKYMHSAGVLHRDLKPQNILINSNLAARICDLGLARVSAPRDGLSTGYVTTRWYRAPEVMLTWQHYTNALDVWSVGCILAEMLNRLNKRATFIDSKSRVAYYAIFPADSHAEHLRMILETLGAPPPQVIDLINEASICDFVNDMVRETQGLWPL
jgi:p38 MAP kinase